MGELRYINSRSQSFAGEPAPVRKGAELTVWQRQLWRRAGSRILKQSIQEHKKPDGPEQVLAENIAGDSRLIACTQQAANLPVTYADDSTRSRLERRGIHEEVGRLQAEYAASRGEPVSDSVMAVAWAICMDLTKQQHQR